MRYAKVDRRIWNDARFRSLSERGKLVFLFLLTHPNLTMLGAMRTTIPGLAAELEMPVEGFAEAFAEGLSKGLAKHDSKASFLWLPKFLKYNRPESPNVVKAWPDAFDLLPECDMKCQLFEGLKAFVEGLTEGFREAFRKGFPKDYTKDYAKPVTVTVTVTGTGTGKSISSNPSDFDHAQLDPSLFLMEKANGGSGPASSTAGKDNLERAVESGWTYFLEQTGKHASQYQFTHDRLVMGRRGFESLISFAKRRGHEQPLDASLELFRVAVDRLVSSPFHAGKNLQGTKYLDWHQLFTGKGYPAPQKLLEFWLDDSKWPE